MKPIPHDEAVKWCSQQIYDNATNAANVPAYRLQLCHTFLDAATALNMLGSFLDYYEQIHGGNLVETREFVMEVIPQWMRLHDREFEHAEDAIEKLVARLKKLVDKEMRSSRYGEAGDEARRAEEVSWRTERSEAERSPK